MSLVRDTLPEDSPLLERLRNAFSREHMDTLFSTVMAGRYARTATYVKELFALFHHEVPPDALTSRSRLSEQDRERCIIAILASRGSVRNLGIHIYVALMLKVTAEEIADTIFLAGAYSGVPAVADGLDTEIEVLNTLKNLAEDQTKEPNVNTVFAALKKLQL